MPLGLGFRCLRCGRLLHLRDARRGGRQHEECELATQAEQAALNAFPDPKLSSDPFQKIVDAMKKAGMTASMFEESMRLVADAFLTLTLEQSRRDHESDDEFRERVARAYWRYR